MLFFRFNPLKKPNSSSVDKKKCIILTENLRMSKKSSIFADFCA